MTARVAVYGGSFDPFTLGHRAFVQAIIESGAFDQLEIVPSAAHAFKPHLNPISHRMHMARVGTADLAERFPIIVSPIEVLLLEEFGPPVRTWELLQAVRSRYAVGTQIKFIIGPDLRKDFPRWHRVEDIEREFGFFELSPLRFLRATDVRNLIRSNDPSWRLAVPGLVAEYIEEHPGLYGPETREERVG